jgi:Mg-chelatase subunit ChlI
MNCRRTVSFPSYHPFLSALTKCRKNQMLICMRVRICRLITCTIDRAIYAFADLYGAEEVYDAGLEETTADKDSSSPAQTRPTSEKNDISNGKHDDTAKDTRSPTEKSSKEVHSPSKSSNASTPQLSYSAQIAQQFSSYTQTPSQERQQRGLNGLPPPLGRPAPIASYESRTQNENPVAFADKAVVRPSEMKDEG